MTNALSIERRGPVTIAHIDDGKANALSPDLVAAINAALDDAEADESTGALVLHGRPGVFSGGFDLNIMRGTDLDVMIKLVADGGALVRRLYGSGIPVVAACTGHAMAAGALLLLGCDLRIGADIEAKVGLPEVNIQMTLPTWAVTIGQDRISKRHAARAMALGLLTTPAAAVDVGYLDEVYPADDVLDRAVAAATSIADTIHLPSYRGTIARLRQPVLDTMADQIAADLATIGQ